MKLGMTTIASRIARHFSLTLKAMKYDTGKPMSRHSSVAKTAIFERAAEHVEEQRRRTTSR